MHPAHFIATLGKGKAPGHFFSGIQRVCWVWGATASEKHWQGPCQKVAVKVSHGYNVRSPPMLDLSLLTAEVSAAEQGQAPSIYQAPTVPCLFLS